MAVITNLPSLDIIDGFRGTIDYYCNMGLLCVRKWPRSPGHNRAPAVMAQWPAFKYANQSWHSLSSNIKLAYTDMASGSRLTCKDLFIRSYIKGESYE